MKCLQHSRPVDGRKCTSIGLCSEQSIFQTTPLPFHEKAAELFEKSIAQNIVQSKCISCHRRGGYAGGTSLIFEGASGGTSHSANIASFEGLLNRRADGLNHILRKVSGNGHDHFHLPF